MYGKLETLNYSVLNEMFLSNFSLSETRKLHRRGDRKIVRASGAGGHQEKNPSIYNKMDTHMNSKTMTG